jgi:hypothetical protein
MSEELLDIRGFSLPLWEGVRGRVKETDTFSALTPACGGIFDLSLSQREREPIITLGNRNEKPTAL